MRSAVLKENKGAVSLVPWLCHLLWPVSGKGCKDEVRVKGYSPTHVPLCFFGLWIS